MLILKLARRIRPGLGGLLLLGAIRVLTIEPISAGWAQTTTSADHKAIVVFVNQATLDAVKSFDSETVFLTSRDNPIETLRGLTRQEIASWSGHDLMNSDYIQKVMAFQAAAGIPNSGTVSTYGIGKGRAKISEMKTYNSQKPVRLFITHTYYEPTIDDAARIDFELEK